MSGTPTFTPVYSAEVAAHSQFAGIDAALRRAMSDIAAVIDSSASIEVGVAFDPELSDDTLATGGFPTSLPYGRFSDVSGGIQIFSPIGVVELLTGVDTNGDEEEATLNINPAKVDQLFFGVQDGQGVPSNKFDALTIFRHELVHALGFLASSSNQGLTVYDTLLADERASGNVTLRALVGPNSSRATGPGFVPIIRDNLSHVAEFGNGEDDTSNELMRPTLPRGNRRDISPLTMAVLGDIGVPLKTEVFANIGDGRVIPRITLGDVTASEADGTLTVPVMLSSALVNDAELRIEVRDVGASKTALADPLSGAKSAVASLVIAAGATDGQIVIPVANNSVFNSSAVYDVSVRELNLAAVVADATARVTVTNDEVSPQITLTPEVVAEADGVINFVLAVSTPVATDLVFDVNTSGGTATAGSDYTALSSTVTIAAGQTSVTIAVTVLADAETEGQETIVLSAQQQGGSSALQATGVLNDSSEPPVMTISDVSLTEGNGSTQISLTVTLSRTASVDVQAAVSLSGPAALINRITLPSGPIVVPAGQTSASYVLSLAGNVVAGDGGEISVRITQTIGATVQPRGGGAGVTPTTDNPVAAALITVVDDDNSLVVRRGTVTVPRQGARAATVRLSGPGTLQVSSNTAGDSIVVTLTRTTARSALTVTSQLPIALGSLSVDGLLGGLTAASASIASEVSISGLTRLSLGSVGSGGSLTVVPGGVVSVVVGNLSAGTVRVNGAVRSLSATSVGSGAVFSAVSIGGAKVRGSFSGRLVADTTLGAISMADVTGGEIFAGSGIRSFSARSLSSSTVRVAASSNAITEAGQFSSATAALGSVKVSGATSGSFVVAPVLGRVSFRTVTGSTLIADSLAGLSASGPRLRIARTTGPLSQPGDAVAVTVL